MNDRNINKPTGNNTPKPDSDKKQTSTVDKARYEVKDKVSAIVDGKRK